MFEIAGVTFALLMFESPEVTFLLKGEDWESSHMLLEP
jgi:hypothetical protein